MRGRDEAPDDVAGRRRELLIRLLREEAGVEVRRAEAIPRRRPEEALLPSFAQQRLWFLDQLHPGSPAYNLPAALRLRGALDGRALERSLVEIVRRHEALRTTFALARGGPVQIVAPSLEPPLSRSDLRARPASGREDAMWRLVREEARRPFDLSTGPLVRAGLVALADEDHVLWLVMHHIVSDGWSMGVLVRELAALYDAFSRGEPSPLPEPPIQYADFAAWQRRWLQGDRLEGQRSWWRAQLGGGLPGLQLPADRPRPAVQTYRGAWRTEVLPGSLAGALRDLSRREGTTLFMTLLAGFQALLHRCTGQEAFLIGTPDANRGRPETEGLIGFFVNTLALRADVSGNPGFRELLRRVRETTLAAYAHRDLPFERLVEDLQPERDTSRQPLFQVAFVLQNAPLPALELPGLELTLLDVDTGTAKFDLTLSLSEAEDGLAASIEYSTDLFEDATIGRMLGHLRTLLEGAARDPDRRIGELPILSPAERHALLRVWNDPRVDLPAEPCLHRLFEAQAARRPGAAAASLGDDRLTYRELNERANRLARCLRRRGVGPEVLVGLCMDRSLDMLVAILAILKAGGAYVPLDPAYPRERQGFILDDARAGLLVTQRSLVEGLPGPGARAILIEEAERASAAESGEDLDAGPPTGAAAYVIYTSGSTGRPKGVPVSHANVARLFGATRPWFRFDETDVWTLFHSCAFDFSVWELWGALLHGGRVVVVPYEVSRSPDRFYELLRRERVTVLNQTPSGFRQLVRVEEDGGGATDLALRYVIFGGEALEPRTLAPWLARHGDDRPRLVNMYGITETTVHVTGRPLARSDLDRPASSFIGRPIPDLRVHLLDAHGQLVPVGVPGEVCVGGAGVARGYLNRPDLTAERFVPDPLSGPPGARLYRSGDLARRSPDGDIEYLGRIDHQVKVRGFRVEPEEIEAALDSHPGVRDSVVVLREEPGGDRRLAAYVVPAGKPAPSIEDLRGFLKETLPEHMVPAHYVVLDALPLTSHGKVDRGALPAPDRGRPELTARYAPPRSDAERTLAAIWSEVLGVADVGIHDNFFALGGDSIRSIQVRARARERGLDFSIQQLFQHQSVADLARHLAVVEPGSAAAGRSRPFALISGEDRARLPEDVEDAYPLSQLQAGFVFHSEISADYIVYVTSVHLRAPLQVEALQRAVDRAVRRHPMLRTSFDMTAYGEPLQLVHREARIPVQVADVTDLESEEQERAMSAWVEAEMKRRFDWTLQPLVRVHVHRRADRTFQLTVSEPFFDGWSVASLITEVLGDYFRSLAGEAGAEQPPPASTYRDFVALELEALASAASRRYWALKLGDCAATRLPRGPLPAGAGDLPAVGRREVPISRAVSDGLRDLARSAGVPLKSALLAAHLKVVAYASGQTDLLTGLIANGRPEELDGDQVLGVFLNTLPLRARLRGGTWEDLARDAFEAERELLPHRRLPMAELQRVHGAQPLFDTCFNYTNFHVYGELAGVEGLEVLDSYGSEQTYFALTAQFNLDEDAPQVTLALDYRRSELGRERAEALAGYYGRALEAMAAAPRGRHDAACLLSAQEERRLVVAWNDTALEFDARRGVHGLIEDRVERAPGATALVDGHERLTYRELNLRANRLAHHLRALGVGIEVPVALCMERTWEMVVAILGILKAGGAYVPIDPAYPEERLAITLEEARAPVLLTQERLRGILPRYGGRTVRVDAEWEAIAAAPGGNPAAGVLPENLAYVLYTSGSTGRPKGAAIRHRGIVALLRWADEVFGADEVEGVLASTSLCFDPSVLELFLPLTRGGKVVLADNVLRLPELPAAREVTMMCTVSSAIDELLRIGGVPDSVRAVTLAGEPLRTALVRRVRQDTGIRKVWNLYGLTEDTVYTTAACVGDETADFAPIGRPIPNTRVHLLDEFMQPVPVGVPGELHIAGEGLPRGYLDRPELTAEKFVPDPFGAQPGARLHKTGDLARLRPDGSIEFVRRIDFQVKVRGFRVELGEIEAILGRHPAVRQAVAAVREDVPGERHIVAYVVPSEEPAPARELRDFLRRKLPDYMVPSFFVALEAFPLTPNGKLDRKALPPPDAAHPERGDPYVAPRTPVEEVLAGIWSRVLRVERVGVQDGFFDLGGHSLLATQAVSRARDAFHLELPLRWLFETPTVAGLGARIETAISEPAHARPPALVAAPREGAPPLSFAQQRLWFLDQLAPGSASYNVPLAVRLSGRLDPAALEASLAEILRRHEALRTTFAAPEGRPVQGVHEAKSLALPLRDLAALPAEGREAEALRHAAGEARRPFDLQRGPLFRAELLRLAPDDHVLLATMHHIVSDGWSIGVLIREIAALYEAFRDGRPSPLPELPIQYADFAVWQRRWLQGEALEAQIAYWRKQLAGCPETLDLPSDRPRPAVQTHRGAYRSLALPAEVASGLRELCRREEVTLFMALLAAFQALLHRYTGQDDVVVGTPIANRNRSEIESLIGFFVNTLALRADHSGDPTFRRLLALVRESALGAYAHQDLPFEHLVEVLQPRRDLSRSPIFQVMFDLQNLPAHSPGLSDLTLTPMGLETGTAKFDLTLTMAELPDGLAGTLEYNTDLFDGETAERMLAHFETLLAGAVADPGRRVSALGLMRSEERRLRLQESEGPRLEAPASRSVWDLFQEQARRSPDRVALVHGSTRITYAQLERQAGRLASRLRALGVGPETRVGLCSDRSPEAIAGMLAVLAAGGAYVPLDPEYPADRLGVMLEDARPAVVLVQERRASSLPRCGASLLHLDGEIGWSQRDADAAPSGPPSPDCAAYVIYTSGSTGRPKGVVVSHASLAHSIGARAVHYREPVSAFLLLSSFSFDSSVAGIYGTLCRGGALHLAPEGAQKDPGRIAELLASEAISHLLCLPSLYGLVLEHAGPRRLASLRTVIVAGESCPPGLVERHHAAAPEVPLFNEYGPTEATVWSTVARCRSLGGDGRVPIGRPIANTRALILDPRIEPVPSGVAGELYVGGGGIARGYLGAADLTADRFVPDPFSSEPGARLYRTGDRARALPGGEIEFLGRCDLQLKVRGVRVEPGDVEAALARHPAVREAVVVARADGGGDARLVAYVAPNGVDGPTAGALRAFLQERLPDSMVPSLFVTLDALPRAPGGKVDRRSLPAPGAARPEVGATFVAPRGPVEEVVAGIWAALLGVERVGAFDDFFDLGGHSLLATQVVSRVREALRVEVPLRAIFEDATVAGLAEGLAGAAGDGAALERTAELVLRLARMPEEEVARRLEADPRSRGEAEAG